MNHITNRKPFALIGLSLTLLLALSVFKSPLLFGMTQEPGGLHSDSMPIKLSRVRELNVSSSPGLPSYVAAASGLAQAHNSFYVAVDDELHLGVFPLPPSLEAGQFYRVFPGALPSDHKERKKKKPDLESLTFLDENYFGPAGAILAIPSGSKSNRTQGILVQFQENGELPAHPKQVNFQNLYKKLLLTFPDLNIEGVTPVGSVLKLFQRGNGASGQNATIDLNLSEVVQDLKADRPLAPERIVRIQNHDLGTIRGVRLTFTDAFTSPALGTWFLAAAEAADSTYDDGAFSGAVIGKLNSQGEVIFTQELDIPFKPEGLWIDSDPTQPRFYVVTDADDSSRPAEMYQGLLPLTE